MERAGAEREDFRSGLFRPMGSRYPSRQVLINSVTVRLIPVTSGVSLLIEKQELTS